MIFRLTQKLCSKIKAGNLIVMPADDDPYADWTCRLFMVQRIQYVLLTNTPTLYSCVMPGKGITNNSQFVERSLQTIREFLQYDQQQFAYDKFVESAAGPICFARALNRSITGSMNDLVHAAELDLEQGIPLNEIGTRLNDTPLSAIEYLGPRLMLNSLKDRAEEQK